MKKQKKTYHIITPSKLDLDLDSCYMEPKIGVPSKDTIYMQMEIYRMFAKEKGETKCPMMKK